LSPSLAGAAFWPPRAKPKAGENPGLRFSNYGTLSLKYLEVKPQAPLTASTIRLKRALSANVLAILLELILFF
jgi:hypothetical protein